ncbi:PREDICTED: lipoma HMGIC fusion partner-like [Amphimedon queenslandica]|uniref:Uncharacterized protein n=1 Tax=Amphimedon queenslandica TaxID=400682 RepID=A0A1X7VCC5_AMPQE|nr:PREDICTED: lipoma HMGIC fusion partner-like [Amphimedon queenslandica]|eukprot:XP_011402532.1 PREDICTED: lipoma HMGIC fusion partner-like [Amphimedon queenslandica]
MASCCSSYTPLAYIWTVLSVIAALLCPFGLYFSNWLERVSPDGNSITSLSSFRRCPNDTSQISVACEEYLSFGEIYSAAWQAVTLLFGLGACLLILVALTSLFGLCIRHLFNKCVGIITITSQTIGVLLYIAGILVFPVGWNSPRVTSLCGLNSGLYKLGDCRIGWAFIVIIIGTAVALVAAILSWTPLIKREKDRSRRSNNDLTVPYTV